MGNHETPRYPGYVTIESGMFAEPIEAAQGDQIDNMAIATIASGAWGTS